MRLRHDKLFGAFVLPLKPNCQKNFIKPTMNRTESKHELTTSSKPSDFNVIESLRQYNRSQINKILCIENDTTALDYDVDRTTHQNELPQPSKPAGVTKTVVYCLVCMC